MGRFTIGYLRYYPKIKEYVNNLPQGTKFTSSEISSALNIKYKYVIKALREMVEKGDMIE